MSDQRETMWVCSHCLAAIESREGNQATLCHDIGLEFDEEDFDKMSKCDWCEQEGFDELYELI
jgi:predicted Zn-ribbon and HTH transcriptional regulator